MCDMQSMVWYVRDIEERVVCLHTLSYIHTILYSQHSMRYPRVDVMYVYMYVCMYVQIPQIEYASTPPHHETLTGTAMWCGEAHRRCRSEPSPPHV